MQETIEQVCQRILDARGYLVGAMHMKCNIGDIIPWIHGESFSIDHPTVVTAETDADDFYKQRMMALGRRGSEMKAPYYYRVTAE